MGYHGKKVLVVENDPELLILMRYILEPLGFEVLTCLSAQQALDTLAAHPIDLLIASFALPHLNGIDVLRYVRCHHSRPDLPFILLSANPTYRVSITAYEEGVSRFVLKPFRLAEIQKVVGEVMQR